MTESKDTIEMLQQAGVASFNRVNEIHRVLSLSLENERLRRALEEIAMLGGNGVTYGNSNGNLMALRALQAPAVSTQALLEVVRLAGKVVENTDSILMLESDKIHEVLSPEAVALIEEFGK